MRYFLIALIALALSACTTTSNSFDTAIQKNLPQMCATASQAHAAFVIVASTGNVKPRTVAREAAAWAAVDAVCKNPESFTASTALVKVAEAYAAMTLAMREVQ
jgi:hypothetical protein